MGFRALPGTQNASNGLGRSIGFERFFSFVLAAVALLVLPGGEFLTLNWLFNIWRFLLAHHIRFFSNTTDSDAPCLTLAGAEGCVGNNSSHRFLSFLLPAQTERAVFSKYL